MSDVPQPTGGPVPQDPPPPSFGAPPPVGGPPPARPYGAYVPQPPPVSAVSDFGRPLADWWKRLVAIVIDFIILIVVGQLLGIVLSQHRFTRALLGLVVGFAYYGFLNGSERGQTVGK